MSATFTCECGDAEFALVKTDDEESVWCPECGMRVAPQREVAQQASPPPVVHRKQPMPNDHLDGGTVIASVVYRDNDPALPVEWIVLLLRRSAPFYEVIEVNSYGEVTSLGEARNIVPATELYADNGGDF